MSTSGISDIKDNLAEISLSNFDDERMTYDIY